MKKRECLITSLLFLLSFSMVRIGFSMNEPGTISADGVATYTLIVEGFDWGPAANKVILPVEENISQVNREDFQVAVEKTAECGDTKMPTTNGVRTILYAYVSDGRGNKVEEGNHITLTLLVAPDLPISSPMQYMANCSRNVWADYKMTIENTSNGSVWNSEKERIYPLVEDFDLSGQFSYGSDIHLRYADFTPKTRQKKTPLIIWLHGGGEGGTDPTLALLANRAANYASSEMQAFFDGAYVLVPQSPTFWMDKGNGEYTRGEVNDIYNEPLMALVKDYVARHPDIDVDRIYVGGCSNGGYMSLKLMLQHPNYFAASFPSALAYFAENITGEQIEKIKHMPIWFIHSKDDPVTRADQTVVPLYKRLVAAGAKNVHFSNYDHVVDITGFFGGDDYHYLGHFSWIYSHANHASLDYDNKPVRIDGKPVTVMEWLAAQRRSR